MSDYTMNFYSFKKLANTRFQIISCVIIVFFLTVIVGVLATLNIGGLDDAYITYIFAKNLADGYGIVWIVGGDPVYGSTTFSVQFLLLGGNESQTSFAKIPVDNQIVGLRIDPLDSPGKIIINNLSIWRK